MAIADIPRILYSCVEDEAKGLSEEKLAELQALCNGLRDTGLYMYFTNEFFEVYTGILANNLELRKFILSLSERFHLKLALNADVNGRTLDEYVKYALEEIRTVVLRQRNILRSEGSCVLDAIQASLNLVDIQNVLENNPHYLVFYMALATNALHAYFDTLEDNHHTKTP